MNALFADAVYLMALVNPRDESYARAVAFERTGLGRESFNKGELACHILLLHVRGRHWQV